MDRTSAEKELKKIFGINKFYDTQWEVVEKLFSGKRVLLIEKTGFGKSLCYQFPATQLSGITVVFSPLIALMRDQVRVLQANGINAKCINSQQSAEENNAIIREAVEGKIKILYIAPERQENKEWIEATRKMNLSMVVIDEAHTISVWGHDFRPAFRRIINLVKLLPENFPVLATTATATPKVQKDIERQITGKVLTVRGNLVRKNFELYVIKVKSEDEKFLWLGENLHRLEGTGIIYTGTRVNTEIYSRWFEFLGINTIEYNAGLDAETRKIIEKGLMNNKWKAIISTNALGMGIDKSDIRFIIHTQIPASPIHYYQEIGRAGRDRKPAKLILFYNEAKDKNGIAEDLKLQISFIDKSRPPIEDYQKVINALKRQPLGEKQIMKETNLKQNPVRVIKADLIEQGIIKEVFYGRSRKYEYQFDAPSLNTKPFEELRKWKLEQLNAMVEYVNLETSRMKFLCEYLGDFSQRSYGNCDNTTLPKFTVKPPKHLQEKLKNFRENYFPVLKLKDKHSKIIDGVAASYYGVSNVGSALHRSKYETGEDFPDFLLELTLRAFKKHYKNQYFDYLLYVPPTESGNLAKNFAEKLSRRLGISVSHNLIKTETTQPQKVFQNSYLKKENVAGKFDYLNPEEIQGKSLLLFDDIFDSGATIKEIAKLLTKLGAEKIAPLVIAKTVGGDI